MGIVILGKHFIQRLLNISCLRSANFRTLSLEHCKNQQSTVICKEHAYYSRDAAISLNSGWR